MCCLLNSIRWTRGRKTRLFVYLKFKPHLHYTGVDLALFTHVASTLACKQHICTIVRAFASILPLQPGWRTWKFSTSKIKTLNWTIRGASYTYLRSTPITHFPKVQGLWDLRICRWSLDRLIYCPLRCCCVVRKTGTKVLRETVAFAFGVDGLTYPEDRADPTEMSVRIHQDLRLHITEDSNFPTFLIRASKWPLTEIPSHQMSLPVRPRNNSMEQCFLGSW
jgi:hypothetical protein